MLKTVTISGCCKDSLNDNMESYTKTSNEGSSWQLLNFMETSETRESMMIQFSFNFQSWEWLFDKHKILKK